MGPIVKDLANANEAWVLGVVYSRAYRCVQAELWI